MSNLNTHPISTFLCRIRKYVRPIFINTPLRQLNSLNSKYDSHSNSWFIQLGPFWTFDFSKWKVNIKCLLPFLTCCTYILHTFISICTYLHMYGGGTVKKWFTSFFDMLYLHFTHFHFNMYLSMYGGGTIKKWYTPQKKLMNRLS